MRRKLVQPSNPVGLVAYQFGLVALTVAIAVVCVIGGWSIGGWPVGGLAIVAVLAERGRVRVANRLEASISLLPRVFAAALFGPLAALVVGLASFLLDAPALQSRQSRQNRQNRAAEQTVGAPWLKWGVYTCTRGIAAGLAGFVVLGITAFSPSGITGIILATVGAAFAAEGLDILFLALTMSIRGGSPIKAFKAVGGVTLVSITLYVPLIGLLAVAYRDLSPWTLVFFFVPSLAAQRLYALYQRQSELADNLISLNATLEQANLSFASALVATLDARDRYTAGHSAAVAIYARDIAKGMGLSEREQQLAHLCGLVHDIGKIGLPAGLLEKPGALTLDERREMQRHSTIGERILANVETYSEIASVVRHHHERLDGNGYPDGVAGDAIPLLARIIAVADAYNAMTSDRPYRDAMPTRVARVRLAQAAESQFDTSIVAAFEAVLASATDDYRRATGEEFLWLRNQSPDGPELPALSDPMRWYATTA